LKKVRSRKSKVSGKIEDGREKTKDRSQGAGKPEFKDAGKSDGNDKGEKTNSHISRWNLLSAI